MKQKTLIGCLAGIIISNFSAGHAEESHPLSAERVFVDQQAVKAWFAHLDMPESINECGPTPTTISFGHNFHKGEMWLKKSYFNNQLGVSATVPIYDVPVDIDANDNKTVSDDELRAMNESDALTWVQRAITDNRQALLAECGYRLCTLELSQSKPDGGIFEASTEIMGRICEAALSGTAVDAPGPSAPGPSADVSFIPSRRIFTFARNQEKSQVHLTLSVRPRSTRVIRVG
jgi:hypothetical protein